MALAGVDGTPGNSNGDSELYEFGPFRLDTREGSLHRDGHPVPLTPKVFETLLVLVRHAGRIMDRETLLRTLWPDAAVAEGNLTQHVWMLRKALDDKDEDSRYIQTVPRRGYRFIAPVVRVGAGALEVPAAAGPQRAADTHVLALSRGLLRRHPAVAGGLFAVVLLAAVAGIQWRLWAPGDRGESPAGAPTRRTVAVLGFKNLSGRAGAAWLSTAFAEMLSTELAAGERLRVIPGETVARVKADLSLPEADALARDTLARIRSQLGADAVVLGSYVESGGRIRLDVRVQDAAAGETLASVAETGSQDLLLDLVARTGARLRASLGIGDVSAADAGALRASMPSSPDAVRLYAEGLARMRLFETLAAKDLLERAVAADPGNPLVHSALAEAWATLGYDERARAAARRALDLSAALPREERLFVEGRYHEAARAWDEAIGAYQALARVFPDNLEYGLRLGETQTAAGRGQDALATVSILRRLPPPSSEDPRIDLLEAAAADAVSDFRRSQALAARAAAKGSAGGARLLVARARLHEGRALSSLGELGAAAKAAQEARRIFTELGDRAAAGRALNLSGNVLLQQGDLAGARRTYEEYLQTSREIGSKLGMAISLNNIALVLSEQGDLAGARRKYEESLALNREMGDRVGQAVKINNIAVLLAQQGDVAGARRLYEQSLALARETGNKASVSNALNNIAALLSQEGDLAGARRMYEESLGIAREIGEKEGMAVGSNNIGSLLERDGDLGAARKSYEEALAIYRAMGDVLGVASELNNVGSLLAQQGHLAESRTTYGEALAMHRRAGSRSGEAWSLHGLGDLAAIDGDLARARRTYEEALALRTEMGERGEAAQTRVALAEVALVDGRLDEAVAHLLAAAEEFARQRRAEDEATARALLARCLLRKNRLRDAQAASDRARELAGVGQTLYVRLSVALASARVSAASGRGDQAVRDAEGALAAARTAGLVAFQLEAALALGEVEARTGRTDAARARLAAVERDATARGFHLIARRAAAVRG